MTTLLPLALGVLLQSSALLVLGLLALSLTRRLGPTVQTLIGRATLVGVALTLLLAGPLTGHVRPLWRVPLPADVSPAPTVRGTGFEGAPPAEAPPAPNSAPGITAPAPPPTTVLPPTVPEAPPVPILTRLYTTLTALWAIGTAALLLWLGVCQWHLTRLERAACPLTSGPAADILADLSPRSPRLVSHSAVGSPFLAGISRPAIFLPANAEADLSADALRAVLAHELAHAARRDCAWTLFCRILCAVLWPQPLLWLLCRRLEAVGEEACDQAVLAQNCPPRTYADCLLTLAERYPLRRRERALGAGVAPFRSSLGRRIGQILAARKPLQGLTRSLRFGIASCALLAVCLNLVLLNAGADVDVPHFTWAKQQGWAVRPIRIIDLDHPGLTRVASLPGDVTERDRAAVNQLSRHGMIFYGPQGAPVSVRLHLERVLAQQPHFFYAEYLLGVWYRQHGDAARASALITQSLRDAPVVLAGRYEYDDGTPLAGFHFSTGIQCYSPAQLKAKNGTEFRALSAELSYADVVTDADGCYYLPVYRAIYSQTGRGWQPDQLNALTASHVKAHADLNTPGPATSGTTSDSDGEHLDKGFIAESRVAVMPQTEIRAKIALSAPFNSAEGSIRKPIQIHGSRLVISWPPYPRATSYKVVVEEHHPQRDKSGGFGGDEWNEISASPSNPSRLGLPMSQTSVSLDLAGSDPVFNRTLSYTLTVLALDRDGETITQSDQYDFQPRNALAPQPLTKAALAQALGPGVQVTSIRSQADEVDVTAITPAGLLWSAARDQAMQNSGRRFGLGSPGISYNPGIHMNGPNAAETMLITYSRSLY